MRVISVDFDLNDKVWYGMVWYFILLQVAKCPKTQNIIKKVLSIEQQNISY